jgi:TonB family protein
MIPQQNQVIIAGSYRSIPIDAALIRNVKGKGSTLADRRFMIIAFLSFTLHIVFIFYLRNKELVPLQTVAIEEIPERFAKFIIEKPIPKAETLKKTSETGTDATKKPVEKAEEKPVPTAGPITPKQRAKAQRSVDARVARVEQKIRTVGVLGMLTGMGPTAKGPSVVDVLGSIKDRKESNIDLEAALNKMTGLQKTGQIDVLDRKLVKSKDLSVSHKEDIDDLLASVGNAKTVDLAKKGSFIIQKPESIEGAASSNAKRDNDAINAIVSSHKASIRMSYEKYLKRDPTLAGKITVRFTIASSGNIAMATVVDNTTGNREFEEEIIRKIRMWRFEEIPDGDVTVTYPFVFAPAG